MTWTGPMTVTDQENTAKRDVGNEGSIRVLLTLETAEDPSHVVKLDARLNSNEEVTYMLYRPKLSVHGCSYDQTLKMWVMKTSLIKE